MQQLRGIELCASARKVNSQQETQQLRSIQHVCKCTPPPPQYEKMHDYTDGVRADSKNMLLIRFVSGRFDHLGLGRVINVDINVSPICETFQGPRFVAVWYRCWLTFLRLVLL